MTLQFGRYTVDTQRRELRGDGALIHVEPQVFDVLAYLAEHRNRVISKDELFETVWKGRIVSDATLSSRINAARRAIGDTGEQQSLIRTVPRRGFLFAGEVATDDPSKSVPTPRTAGQAARQQKVTFCKSADRVNLAVATVGEGPPLVKTGNWLNHLEYDWQSPVWQVLFQELSADHQLIRYDARGSGLSDRSVAEISFDAFVRDLETVIDAQGIERCSLLGISQGAAVAIAYAARHPQRVEKLVVHGGYAQGRRQRGSAADHEQADAFLTLMRYGWGDEHSPFMQAFSSIYLPKGTPHQIRWFTELQQMSTSGENAARIRMACDLIDVVDLLPQVRAPTLVTHSRHDHVVPLEQGRLIATSIPNSRFVTLESDNHPILPDEPAWPTWIGEIKTFLAERV